VVTKVPRLLLRTPAHLRSQDAGSPPKLRRPPPQPARPALHVESRPDHRLHVHHRFLEREIVRLVLGRHFHFPLRADLDEPLDRHPVGAIRLAPHALPNGCRLVFDRQRHRCGELRLLARDAVVVIQLRAADTNGHVQPAPVLLLDGFHGAQRRRHADSLPLGDFVADEIRRRIAFLAQNAEVPVQLFGQDRQQAGTLGTGQLHPDQQGRRTHAPRHAFRISRARTIPAAPSTLLVRRYTMRTP
jgi:hypothetical protein